MLWRGKKVLPLSQIEPRLSGCPTRILVTTVAQLSRIKYRIKLAESYMIPMQFVFRFCGTTVLQDMSFCLTSCTFNDLREQNLLPVRIDTRHYTMCARRGLLSCCIYRQVTVRPLLCLHLLREVILVLRSVVCARN